MMHSRTFPAEAASASAARQFTRTHLRDAAPELIEPLELMVSELATNCIKHAHSTFELALTITGDAIKVEVTDTAAGAPVMQSPGPQDLTGRGLRIVDLLSDRWGVRQAGSAKTVWFTIQPEHQHRANPSAGPQHTGC